MPGNFLTADTGFPTLTKEQSTEEKFGQIQSYLYLLLEQLRYSMGNLDKNNFNEAGLQEIAGIITSPVYVQLNNTEGQITALQITAEGIASRVSSAEGAVSALQQTAGLLSSKITSAQGDISLLTQTANSLSSRLTDAEGSVSSLTQTVNSFSLSVTNGTSSATLQLKAGSTVLSSQNITFSGMVTFATLNSGLDAVTGSISSSLATSGATIINGDNIKTGTISAITVEGCLLRSILGSYGNVSGEIQMCYLNAGYAAGGIRLDDQGAGSETERRYRMFLYTNYVCGIGFAMKLQSASGISITANENIYLSGSVVTINAPTIKLFGTVYVNQMPI